MRITHFIIGLLVAVLCISLYAQFLGSMSASYEISYDNSTIEAYDQLESLRNQTEDINTEVEDMQSTEGTDLLGSLFGAGFTSLKLTSSSIDTFSTMADASFTESQVFGNNGGDLKAVLISIVIISIVVGIFISAILKYPV